MQQKITAFFGENKLLGKVANRMPPYIYLFKNPDGELSVSALDELPITPHTTPTIPIIPR